MDTSETMIPKKLTQFMIVWCDSKCIRIGDGGWDMIPVLGYVWNQNKTPSLEFFETFACLLKKIIFKNISLHLQLYNIKLQ